MFLTFSIKTKLFAWKCQIRKHNASSQNLDVLDISQCLSLETSPPPTLPTVEMSKCQCKINQKNTSCGIFFFLLSHKIRNFHLVLIFFPLKKKRLKEKG